MKPVAVWISRYPLIAFYVICYAITWMLWVPVMAERSEVAELLAAAAVFGGPGIACLLVARVAAQPAHTSRPVPFRLALFGAWIVCAAIFVVNQALTRPDIPVPALVLFVLIAVIPATLLAAAASGAPGVRHTLSSLARPRGHWGWYLLALLLPVAMRLVSVRLAHLLGWRMLTDPAPALASPRQWATVVVTFLYTLIYSGGLNEEIGWTGLALPRFLDRATPLFATVLVWAFWMLWHVPLHLAGYFELNQHVLIGSFFGRFLMTWLYIRSGGGIWTAMLLHASVNVTSQFVPVTNASLMVDGAVAIAVLIAGRMWRHPGECRMAQGTRRCTRDRAN
jgi:membrane protease YdiL (CAAX protease family)